MIRPPMAMLPCLVIACLLAALSTTAASGPFALLHSIFDPGTNAQAGPQQGYSVAIEGNLVIVGAPFDDTAGKDCGSVKIYDAISGSQLHTLNVSTPAESDRFGWTVSVSGSLVVIGAPYASFGATNAGSAYVYDLASATPTMPLLTLRNPTPAAFDNFGAAVAISGSRIVIGAHQDDAVLSDSGVAHVYDLSNTVPSMPTMTLTNPSPGFSDYFGSSVAISGARVAIGAWSDDTGAFDSGIAYVYDLSGNAPHIPVVTLTNPSPAFADTYGRSVAISGTRVVVGAPKDRAAVIGAGSAFVYDVAGPTPALPLLTLLSPVPADTAEFGTAVSISGNQVVIGAPNRNGPLFATGIAYAYDLSGVSPTVPILTLTNPTSANNDFFGQAVAVSGTRVVIGAFSDDTAASDAGSAYLYDLSAVTPATPVAILATPSLTPTDYFGSAVAISGRHVVIGAYWEDTRAINVNSGRAYLYDLASDRPSAPALVLTNPTPNAGDYFGYAVAISGTRVVVGAYGEELGTADVGIAYVYDIANAIPTAPLLTLNNPNPAETFLFGWAVAISGERVVVGASGLGGSPGNSDRAYVYNLAGAMPMVPEITITNPSPTAGERFGRSVAICGADVIVGAYYANLGAPDAGTAYAYDLDGPAPTVPVFRLNNPSPLSGETFGYSVAISNRRAVVGASGKRVGGFFAGSAFVYDLAGPTPSIPTFTLPNPTPAHNDHFGRSVAIFGTRIVVGALEDDAGGTNSGIAYVYDVAGPQPSVPLFILNNPSPAASDNFGAAVAIDGITVAVGTPNDDTNGQDRGAAYVFGLRPALTVAPAGSGFVTLTWTPSNVAFVLQYSDTLASMSWVNAPSDTSNPVTVPITNAARFYRLALP